MKKDLYEVIGVDKKAGKDEIKKKYRAKSKQVHPDKNEGKTEAFQELSFAYGILMDDNSRKRYDETGQTSRINEDAMFTEFVNGVVLPIIENSSDVDSLDLVKSVNERVNEILAEIKSVIRKNEKQVNKLEKFLRRLKLNGNNDVIKRVVEANRDMLVQQINGNNDNLEMIKKNLKIFSEYGYDFEKEESFESRIARDKSRFSSIFGNI